MKRRAAIATVLLVLVGVGIAAFTIFNRTARWPSFRVGWRPTSSS